MKEDQKKKKLEEDLRVLRQKVEEYRETVFLRSLSAHMKRVVDGYEFSASDMAIVREINKLCNKRAELMAYSNRIAQIRVEQEIAELLECIDY